MRYWRSSWRLELDQAMPLSRRLTHFSPSLAASRASAPDRFSPTSIPKRTMLAHPQFGDAWRRIVRWIRMAHGEQKTERKSAPSSQFICLVYAARWMRSMKFRNASSLIYSKTRRRRLVRSFRLEEEPPKPGQWATSVSLVFIPQRISELLVMQG